MSTGGLRLGLRFFGAPRVRNHKMVRTSIPSCRSIKLVLFSHVRPFDPPRNGEARCRDAVDCGLAPAGAIQKGRTIQRAHPRSKSSSKPLPGPTGMRIQFPTCKISSPRLQDRPLRQKQDLTRACPPQAWRRRVAAARYSAARRGPRRDRGNRSGSLRGPGNTRR